MVEIHIEGKNGKVRTFEVREPQGGERVVNITRGGFFLGQAVETTPSTLKEMLSRIKILKKRKR